MISAAASQSINRNRLARDYADACDWFTAEIHYTYQGTLKRTAYSLALASLTVLLADLREDIAKETAPWFETPADDKQPVIV